LIICMTNINNTYYICQDEFGILNVTSLLTAKIAKAAKINLLYLGDSFVSRLADSE
jgi:hypothetical protein